MKPSKRIEQIAYGLNNDYGVSELLFAIKRYLDEEWEKNKPCQHKSSYTVDSTSDVYYNVCNDCGVLFLGK